MKRIAGIFVLSLALGGCGDIEWFPSAPPASTTTVQQQMSSSTATASASIKDSTKTVTASNLLTTKVSSSATSVDLSFKVDVTNSGSSSTPVTVWIAGKDTNGFELVTAYASDPSVSAGESKTLTKTWLVDASVFNRVTTWQIKLVEKI